jgi:hypothetical protein
MNCRIVEWTGQEPDRSRAAASAPPSKRVPRQDLLDMLAGIDMVLTSMLLDAEQRRAGNRTRDIISKHL